jgi:hypothetical protein
MQSMGIRNSFFCLFILLSIISCKKEIQAEKSDLIEYIKDEENGLSQTKQINGITMNVTYRPTKLMVYQEIENKVQKNTINEDSITNKYKNFLYFILSYSKDNKELLSTIGSSRESFNNVQNILTFDMINRVALVNEKKDTIRLIDYNFPRTYGISRSNNLLFIFERNKILEKSKELTFMVQDIGIGTGDVKFKYPADVIKDN